MSLKKNKLKKYIFLDYIYIVVTIFCSLFDKINNIIIL